MHFIRDLVGMVFLHAEHLKVNQIKLENMPHGFDRSNLPAKVSQ
jgi:hypothetical protein